MTLHAAFRWHIFPGVGMSDCPLPRVRWPESERGRGAGIGLGNQAAAARPFVRTVMPHTPRSLLLTCLHSNCPSAHAWHSPKKDCASTHFCQQVNSSFEQGNIPNRQSDRSFYTYSAQHTQRLLLGPEFALRRRRRLPDACCIIAASSRKYASPILSLHSPMAF